MRRRVTPLSQCLLFLGIVCIGVLGGCSKDRTGDLYHHVIEFDPDGNILSPYTDKKFATTQPADQYKEILKQMHIALAGKPNPNVIIYVHGGLNSPSDAIGIAQQHLCDIAKADSSCYPVFVIWNSGLIDTYREHLFDVRQGQNNSETRGWGWVDWPIYLVSDALVAIARAPTVWLQQGTTDSDSIVAGVASIFSYDRTQDALEKSKEAAGPTTRPDDTAQRADLWLERKHEVNTAAFFLRLNRLYYDDSRHAATRPATQISISIGVDHSEPIDWVGRGVIYGAFLPFKMFFAPIIDGLGTPAWREMCRRAQAVVDGSSGFTVNSDTTSSEIADYVNRGTAGGLDLFVSELADCAKPDKPGDPPKFRVTLIAHSAGTIALNEVLRRQIQRELKGGSTLPVQSVVYMAAACSIRDFTESVIPFMQLRKHENVNFYNLTLHPSAEMLEAEAYELVPRGSLLCWIDDFLTSPQNPLDRTLGRWDNVVQTPYVFPESLRGRVSIKAFALNRPNSPTTQPILEPQIHGDFTESPFWDPGFWKPAPALNPKGSRISVAEQEKERLKATAPKPVNGPSK